MTVKKKTYHHGDLRSTLLETATEMISTDGVDSVTMRGLSQKIGVSRTAPYRHFADKGELLAAVAEEGFKELTLRLQEVTTNEEIDVLTRFQEMSVAYVHFAVEKPTHYRMMFGDSIFSPEKYKWGDFPGLATAANAAFDEVVQIIQKCQQAGAVMAGDVQYMSIVAWASIHGLASLYIDGSLARVNDIDRLVDFNIQILSNGLQK